MTDEKTTQVQLDEIAAEYGWRIVPVSPVDTRYKRVGWVVSVHYTKDGNVLTAVRERQGTTLIDNLTRNSKDKFAVVDKWLRKQ